MDDAQLGENTKGFDHTNAPPIPEGISRNTMEELPFSLVIADAQLPDMPLVYVNRAFERVTGYSREFVIGRNCRFLQGTDTNPADRQLIHDALEEGREITVDILNYRADGEPFVNRLLISPMHDGETVTHFLGIQSEHPTDSALAERAARLDEQLREVQHRVKNHLALLLALIRLQSRRTTDTKDALGVLANRVEALNMLYEEFSRSGDQGEGSIALGVYVGRVCGALNMIDGHREVRMNLETDEVRATLNSASQVGLLVSELLTNALQHGFADDEAGEVSVRLWCDESGEHACLQVADNGSGIPDGIDWPNTGNLGARIVRDLTGRVKGTIDVETGTEGTTVTITIPLIALGSQDTGK
ncbi:PAS domain-containing protein [Aurantiacibacter flavus]|uniref:histidine kinase n=1 Tax=Aurantiacibacter flavus TaxID=3145232 RepID=A0ABV0CVX4_9SPHN